MARSRTLSEDNLRECYREANSKGSAEASFSKLCEWTSSDSAARRNSRAPSPFFPQTLLALSGCRSGALGIPVPSWLPLGSHVYPSLVLDLQGSRFSAIQDQAC